MAPATRRRMPAPQRREVILAAAEETFGRRGYHGASLDDVAHAAGVSKALIYEHFASKRELHGVAARRRRRPRSSRRVEAAVQRGEDGEQRLRNGIDAFLAFVEEHREAWRALFRDASDPEVAALVARVQRRATGVIARLIASGPSAAAVDDGGAGARDPRADALRRGAVARDAGGHDHREVPREMLVDRAIEFCWHGVGAPRGRGGGGRGPARAPGAVSAPARGAPASRPSSAATTRGSNCVPAAARARRPRRRAPSRGGTGGRRSSRGRRRRRG